MESVAESFQWPVNGRIVSSFGAREAGGANKGIDIAASEGAEVFASRSGTVSFVHPELPRFGKTVIIDHGDGFATVYAYLGDILIQPGQSVLRGQAIAKVGSSIDTGRPAVHFEVRRKQKPQNPSYYLP
jgi:septal ring factor EnvC (AmiA/AmiB activator)